LNALSSQCGLGGCIAKSKDIALKFKRKDNKNTVRLVVYIMQIEALRFKGVVEKVITK